MVDIVARARSSFCSTIICHRSVKSCFHDGTKSRNWIFATIHGHALAKINGWSINWYHWSKTKIRTRQCIMKMSSEYRNVRVFFWEVGVGQLIFGRFRCDHPSAMAGKSFSELSAKSEQMRCEDYYGHRPERDGPILVGIFIGNSLLSIAYSPVYQDSLHHICISFQIMQVL